MLIVFSNHPLPPSLLFQPTVPGIPRPPPRFPTAARPRKLHHHGSSYPGGDAQQHCSELVFPRLVSEQRPKSDDYVGVARVGGFDQQEGPGKPFLCWGGGGREEGRIM